MASETLTEEQIAVLVAMQKRVENPNTKTRVEGKHSRRDFRVFSTDGSHEFALFTRQSSLLPDGFSAGLRWLAKSGESVILMRCNGSDHPHTNSIERDRFESVCHIHQATERYLAVGKKSEGYAQATREYRTLEGALHHIVHLCNISGLKTEQDEPDLFK
ncbi:MAG TPA: hypothetical protein VMV48_11240 [Gallionellaceae bacterium]|nr:hypothetical protein [Gallionellaceae bacterium]